MRRRIRVATAVVAAALAASAPAAARPAKAPTREVRAQLVQRLQAHRLSFRWVACIANGRRFAGRPIVRCNVNFGDPHIEAYCSVLIGGRLVTNHERRAIPCHRDRVGDTPRIVTS